MQISKELIEKNDSLICVTTSYPCLDRISCYLNRRDGSFLVVFYKKKPFFFKVPGKQHVPRD